MKKISSILFFSLLAFAFGLGCSKKSNPDQSNLSRQNLKFVGDASGNKMGFKPNVGSPQMKEPTSPAKNPTANKEEIARAGLTGLKIQNSSGSLAPNSDLAVRAEQYVISAPLSGSGGNTVPYQTPSLEPQKVQTQIVANPIATQVLASRSNSSPSQAGALSPTPLVSSNLGNLNAPLKTAVKSEVSAIPATLPPPNTFSNVQVASLPISIPLEIAPVPLRTQIPTAIVAVELPPKTLPRIVPPLISGPVGVIAEGVSSGSSSVRGPVPSVVSTASVPDGTTTTTVGTTFSPLNDSSKAGNVTASVSVGTSSTASNGPAGSGALVPFNFSEAKTTLYAQNAGGEILPSVPLSVPMGDEAVPYLLNFVSGQNLQDDPGDVVVLPVSFADGTKRFPEAVLKKFSKISKDAQTGKTIEEYSPVMTGRVSVAYFEKAPFPTMKNGDKIIKIFHQFEYELSLDSSQMQQNGYGPAHIWQFPVTPSSQEGNPVNLSFGNLPVKKGLFAIWLYDPNIFFTPTYGQEKAQEEKRARCLKAFDKPLSEEGFDLATPPGTSPENLNLDCLYDQNYFVRAIAFMDAPPPLPPPPPSSPLSVDTQFIFPLSLQKLSFQSLFPF